MKKIAQLLMVGGWLGKKQNYAKFVGGMIKKLPNVKNVKNIYVAKIVRRMLGMRSMMRMMMMMMSTMKGRYENASIANIHFVRIVPVT